MENLLSAELPLLAEEVCLLTMMPKPRHSKNKLNEVSGDILLLTLEIESTYPELYKHLDETPVVFSKVPEKEITITELENYFETLNRQLCNHFNTHELNLK